MKIKKIIFSLFLSVFIISMSCKQQEAHYSQKHKAVVIQNCQLKALINDDMQFVITDNEGKQINEITEHPSFTVEQNGKNIDFILVKDNIKTEQINDEFGDGNQIVVNSIAQLDGGMELSQQLTIRLYSDYPNVILATAKYTNSGEKKIILNKIIDAHFMLDASMQDSSLLPYEFGSYQGTSLKWGVDYVMKLDKDFYHENYMGEQAESKAGGGVPVIDCWNSNMGIAVAHIETSPRLVSFPVKVKDNGKVSMSVVKNEDLVIEPGNTYESITTATIIHDGDFYNALQTYANLMSAQGLKMQEPTPETYEPIWCSWGFRFDFTLEQIYGTLPILKEMGIKWVVIDDRWFDKYGDWNPRANNFPNGEEDIKQMVDSLHSLGFKVKIWWLPTAVQGPEGPFEEKSWVKYGWGLSKLAEEHPEYMIKNKDGSISEDSRFLWNLCPSHPGVHEYVRDLTKLFIHDWGFDGHKLDAYYVVPPCYNPEHKHAYPEESYEQLPELFRIIYEETMKYKPDAVVELCNCGVPQDFHQSVWTNQPVVSDPTGGSTQVRNRIKVMKALWGANAPVYGDFVEFTKGDFASAMGPGGVLGSKFTWPVSDATFPLTPEKEEKWKKWFLLYREKMLSKGEYMNLYNLYYDIPEAHVIKKEDTLYYSFFADNWDGEIEFRGLQTGQKYRVYDYVNNIQIGNTITAENNKLSVTFNKSLLVECKVFSE